MESPSCVDEKKEKESIMELFENYEEEYTPEEVDWGKPEGKEVW